MIAALLLAAAAPQSVVDAEEAFAALAQKRGQWTAFRATAAPDAIMFLPNATRVQDWLKDRKDPPVSVKWWPTKAWQSCDGSLAVTTGGALWPDGRHGYFTTIWKRQPDGGWKWVLDHGDYIDAPRVPPKRVTVGKPLGCKPFVIIQTPPPPEPGSGGFQRYYASDDRTLVVNAIGFSGGHTVIVEFGGDTENKRLFEDRVGVPK